jgi:hypothetical protein
VENIQLAVGRRACYLPFARVLAAAALSCIPFAPSRSSLAPLPDHSESVVLELSALGKHGDEIARAREQVLGILHEQNACTVWFQEADPEPADVFQSLHFEIEVGGPSRIYGGRNGAGQQLFKHPWAAKSYENSGRNSTVLLNANGSFFQSTSMLMEVDSGGMLARPVGNRPLMVSRYGGDTPEAQIVILLHELGHIIRRLPEDDDSLDGRSSRNTSEVLRHCKAATKAAVHNSARSSN